MSTLQEFFSYVQPIVNGCTGFIKTDGYMTHTPGLISFMTADETVCGFIHIPVIFDVYITSEIGKFLQMKDLESQNLNDLYFTAWNVKGQHLAAYYNLYDNIDGRVKCIYNEPDCNNIPGFTDLMGMTAIGYVNVSDGIHNYRVPASKAITPVAKSDEVMLRIYECIYPMNPNLRTIRYTVHKKKFKLDVNIFANIIIT